MPGRLRCTAIDLNNVATARALLTTLSQLASDPANHHKLVVRNRYHFAVPGGSLSSGPGWYVICDSGFPLYPGTAENLNSRLNTDNGSRDNFANPQRTTDPTRNFIKAFTSAGLLTSLSVIVIQESWVCKALGLPTPLCKLDRENVEKCLGLFRGRIVVVPPPTAAKP